MGAWLTGSRGRRSSGSRDAMGSDAMLKNQSLKDRLQPPPPGQQGGLSTWLGTFHHLHVSFVVFLPHFY